MKIDSYSALKALIGIAVFVAVVSQDPNYKDTLHLSQICNIVWMVVVAYMCIVPLKKKIHINSIMAFFAFQISIDLIMKVIKATVFKTTLIIGITDFIPIPLMIYCVAYNFSVLRPERIEEWLQTISWIYCTAGVVLSISSIVASGMSLNDWMDMQIYVYGVGKNAIGQVLGAGILIAFFILDGNNFIKKAIKYSYALVMLAGLFFVQCRSVILGMALIFLIWTVVNFRSIQLQKLLLIALIIVACILVVKSDQLILDQLRLIVEKALFLNKYQGQGVNAFSSGRLDQWQEALLAFAENPILGTTYYVDNFYIYALANTGLIVTITKTILFWWIVYKNLLCRSNNKNFRRFMISISILELFVSFFEAFPPYGPGVATMIFWFFSGICHYNGACKGEDSREKKVYYSEV